MIISVMEIILLTLLICSIIFSQKVSSCATSEAPPFTSIHKNFSSVVKARSVVELTPTAHGQLLELGVRVVRRGWKLEGLQLRGYCHFSFPINDRDLDTQLIIGMAGSPSPSRTKFCGLKCVGVLSYQEGPFLCFDVAYIPH